MKSVVSGQLVSYTDEGVGDVVLLLHGWGSSLQTFEGLAKKLSLDYRVIRLDWPGFGGSPMPKENWAVNDYAHFLADFLEKQEIKSVYAIAAHSFGGRIAIKALSEGYIHPSKLILLGSGGIKHSSSPRQQAYRVIAKTGKMVTSLPGINKFQGLLQAKLYSSAGASDYLNAGNLRPIFLNTIKEDLREAAMKISTPSMLIWGENDTETPLADAKIFHQAIKGSLLHIVPHAGHFVHIDASAEVEKKIEAFLK